RIGFGKVGERRDADACTPVLSIDGTEVAVRLTATRAELLAQPKELEVCDEVGLKPGTHELETTLGGIGLVDQVALVPTELARADADTTPTNSAPDDRAKLTNLGRTTVGADLDLDGPAQVIIGQAAGAGWSASFDGASSQRSEILDTMAGWTIVDPPNAELPATMVAVYTPQRTYSIALGISLLAVTAAAVTAVRRTGARPQRPARRRLPGRPR
ncbi:MAG: hypothetical protein KBF84_13905, partial [Candidatus Microthrix sp.]|nr:hypothetical protein [Candidatus Microthrix sp.]